MPLCEHGATDINRPHRSRLGVSLLRLHQNVNESRNAVQVAESRLHDWHQRWSNRKEQISRRLEVIDRQLETLVKMRELRPQLSLVADPVADEDSAAR